MYHTNDQPPSESATPFGKLTILAIVMLTAIGMAGFATVGAQPSADKEISAKALDDHECDDTEWHFVINQIDEEADAPASINVMWANGTQADVPLDKFTGKVAHYTTTLELNSTVTSATAEIYAEWDGQFNLSHGPCGDEERVPCPVLSVTAEAGPANQLNWTAVDGAENYTIYRATDGVNFTELATVDSATLSYEDTNVTQGQTYQYMVTVHIGEKESTGCDAVEVTSIPVFSTTLAVAAAGILGLGGYALVKRRT